MPILCYKTFKKLTKPNQTKTKQTKSKQTKTKQIKHKHKSKPTKAKNTQPLTLILKNKPNRLRYAKYYYKRNRTEIIDDQYDKSFLVYMDKLARMFPKKLISATELAKRKELKNKHEKI